MMLMSREYLKDSREDKFGGWRLPIIDNKYVICPLWKVKIRIEKCMDCPWHAGMQERRGEICCSEDRLLNLRHCGTLPKRLPHIILTREAIYPHPFECLVCGGILEVERGWQAHHSYTGGCNQYGESYTSYSEVLYFLTINHHRAVVMLNRRWEKADIKKLREKWRIEALIEDQIDEQATLVGGLTREQESFFKKENCREETKQIAKIEEERLRLAKQRITDIRKGLAPKEE